MNNTTNKMKGNMNNTPEKKRGSKIFFTSDTHFGQQRTLELSKRPFKTVEEMDETMVLSWNSKVKKEDTVFHLGDFGKPSVITQLKARCSRLNIRWHNVLEGCISESLSRI